MYKDIQFVIIKTLKWEKKGKINICIALVVRNVLPLL